MTDAVQDHGWKREFYLRFRQLTLSSLKKSGKEEIVFSVDSLVDNGVLQGSFGENTPAGYKVSLFGEALLRTTSNEEQRAALDYAEYAIHHAISRGDHAVRLFKEFHAAFHRRMPDDHFRLDGMANRVLKLLSASNWTDLLGFIRKQDDATVADILAIVGDDLLITECVASKDWHAPFVLEAFNRDGSMSLKTSIVRYLYTLDEQYVTPLTQSPTEALPILLAMLYTLGVQSRKAELSGSINAEYDINQKLSRLLILLGRTKLPLAGEAILNFYSTRCISTRDIVKWELRVHSALLECGPSVIDHLNMHHDDRTVVLTKCFMDALVRTNPSISLSRIRGVLEGVVKSHDYNSQQLIDECARLRWCGDATCRPLLSSVKSIVQAKLRAHQTGGTTGSTELASQQQGAAIAVTTRVLNAVKDAEAAINWIRPLLPVADNKRFVSKALSIYVRSQEDAINYLVRKTGCERAVAIDALRNPSEYTGARGV